LNVAILAASVDPLDRAAEIQADIDFPVAYGATREQGDSIGAWWEDGRSIIQPSEFVLNGEGKVVSATYSTGPIGRLMPEDTLKLISFIESQKNNRVT
jgi:hypothetical protein